MSPSLHIRLLVAGSLLFVPALLADTLELRNGGKVQYLSVSKVEPDGLSLHCSNGITKIPFENLTDASRAAHKLTAKGAESYRFDREIARRKAMADEKAAQARMALVKKEEAARKAAPAPARIITADQLKKHWVSSYPQPRVLDANYRVKSAEYSQLVFDMRGGHYDWIASRRALEWNLKEYTRVGDKTKAAAVRKELDELEKKIREEDRLRLEQRKTAALESISDQLKTLNEKLNSMGLNDACE